MAEVSQLCCRRVRFVRTYQNGRNLVQYVYGLLRSRVLVAFGHVVW